MKERDMNKRAFIWTMATMFLVLCGLVYVRAGLDEVEHMTALLRTVDSAAGWLLSTLGFIVSLIVFAFGGDPQVNGILGILLFFVALFASSMAWGIMVGRFVHVIKEKAEATQNTTTV